MRNFLLTGIISSLIAINLNAQKITVDVRLDSTVLWLGDQVHLTFEVTQEKNQKVMVPLFSDTIVNGLEIVEPVKRDTVKINDNSIKVNHRYLLTSFEDTLYYIPSFPFIVEKDTVWSKSLSLKVIQPFQIDTASHQIADIKPVFQPKYDWSGLIKKILLVLIFAVLLSLIYFFVRKYIQKKPILESVSKEPPLPPHIIALNLLDNIRNEKLWQKGKYKEYYSELTEVLRAYIERRFQIKGLEMTSSEILDSLKTLQKEHKTAYEALYQILQLADLVKFAKWIPTDEESLLSLDNAYTFVNETKIEEEKTSIDDQEKEKQEGQVS